MGYLPVFTTPEGQRETIEAYDAVLRKWPVPYSELDVATGFGDTHVIASGPEDAPPVILLHALFATATSWYRTVDALSDRFRIFAVDVMGEANKSRPTRPITSLDDYVQWFTELADGLSVERADLVGNSFGAFGAAACAMHLPQRVRRLVLVGPAATVHSMAPFYIHMFAPKAVFLLLPWLPGRRAAMRHAVDWMLSGLPRDDAWDEVFHLTMVHGGMTTQLFPRVYSAEEMARIEAPTLLLVGDRERIYRPEEAIRSARELLPAIQAEVVPDAHHIAALANPEWVNERLREFLS